MISFDCSACGQKLKVKDDLAGKKGKCPHCQQSVVVPATSVPLGGATDRQADAEARTLAPDPGPLSHRGTQSRGSGRSHAGQAEKITHGGSPQSGTHSSGAAPAGVRAEHYDFLAPAEQPDELGRLGPYRVLKVLGAGGMGVVFLAEDSTLKRKVALKAMLPSLAASESARQRFLREAQTAAAIEHDHIVPIYQVGQDRGVPFIAMPFLKGESLDERLHREPVLPLAETLRIGREAAKGLAAAHEAGLIHRDIKPANLWLEGAEGRVKILDFGLARAAADNAQLTQTGAIIGTPAFMAPEQASGEKIDSRCDLFSLGCVLYRMTTGEMAFKGKDAISTLMAVATERPKSPREVNPATPAGLSDFILRLLAKTPDRRPASAWKVVETLAALEAERSPAAALAPSSGEARVAEADPDEADSQTVPRARKGVASKVKPGLQGPARALLLTGVLTCAMGVGIGAYIGATALLGRPAEEAAQGSERLFRLARGGHAAAWLLVAVCGAVIYIGGLRMQEASSYRWACAASVLAVLPINFWLVGLPAGIRGLKALRRRDVRRAFQSGQSAPAGVGWLGSGVRDNLLAGGLGSAAAMLILAAAGGLLAYRVGVKMLDDSRIGRSVGAPISSAQGESLAKPGKGSVAGPPKLAEGAEDAWRKAVAAMPVDDQWKAVVAKLKERNPGFDGNAVSTVQGGVVTTVTIQSAGVTDLSPVRALTGLQSLTCNSSKQWSQLVDLSPLKDMKLTTLTCYGTNVSDLSPLKDMKLTFLNCTGTQVSNLSPLKDMKLTTLVCSSTKVSDLSPLKGMELTFLNCVYTPVSDLSPLKGMKLTTLLCNNTQVSDLSPLKDMPLRDLSLTGTRVTDLSPLTGAPLRFLRLDFKRGRDDAILRSITTLVQINGKPVKQFWQEVNAGKP